MKRLITIGALVTGLTLSAQTVPLAWSPSPTPGITNYVLYATTNELSEAALGSALVVFGCGTNLSATVSDIVPGIWRFAVCAVKGGIRSAPSPVFVAEVPQPVPDLHMLVLEYSGTLTNWTGFLRIRSP